MPRVVLLVLLLALPVAAQSGSGFAERYAGPGPAGLAAAKALDAGQAGTVPAGCRPAKVAPGAGPAFAGPAIDTAAVSAFGAAADERGRMWLAVAGRDARLRVYRSDDLGASWLSVLEFRSGTDISRVEVVTGPGDSGCVFVFYLATTQAGDLRALRIGPGDSLNALEFDVAVGPDTVSSFAVAADRDNHYYLYLLYANELRAGRNGSFTRSLDYGKSWEIPQGWWNCWDPCVAAGLGSTVHCAWRYAANGREIHVETSRFLGRPRSWWGHWRVSGSAERCTEPTIARLDTSYDGRAATWAAWTVADRHDRHRDIEFARSDDGGAGWAHVGPPGDERYLDRWAPALAVAPGRPYGPVQLACVAGRIAPDESDSLPGKTDVLWRTTTWWNRSTWSPPASAGEGAVASGAGVTPRVVIPPGAPRGQPVLLFSRRSPDGARGVYAAATWLAPDEPAACPVPGIPRAFFSGGELRLAPPPAGPARLELFDAAGRRIGTAWSLAAGEAAVALAHDLPAGAVFVRVTGAWGVTCSRVAVLR